MRSRWRCHVKWAASEREEKNAWKKGRGQVVVWHHFIFWIIRNAMRITIETFLSWIHSFSTWKNPDDRTPLACALIINFYDSNLVLCHCWDFFCIFFCRCQAEKCSNKISLSQQARNTCLDRGNKCRWRRHKSML